MIHDSTVVAAVEHPDGRDARPPNHVILDSNFVAPFTQKFIGPSRRFGFHDRTALAPVRHPDGRDARPPHHSHGHCMHAIWDGFQADGRDARPRIT